MNIKGDANMNELIKLGKYLKQSQLAWGTSGNISKKKDENTFLITASGTKLENLGENDFVTGNIQTNKLDGSKKPSKETPMHLAIYQNRADAKVVIHSSPFYSTFFACSNLKIDSDLFIEAMYYLEDIAYVDYYHPGSQELADAIAEKSKEANIIIMRNHGIVIFDESIDEACMRLETLEMTCKMILMAKQADISFNHLNQNTVQDFLENALYKPRKKKG